MYFTDLLSRGIETFARVLTQSFLILCSPGSLSMGLSQQEYWNGLPFPPPGDLPDPGIKPPSPDGSCIGRQILYL